MRGTVAVLLTWWLVVPVTIPNGTTEWKGMTPHLTKDDCEATWRSVVKQQHEGSARETLRQFSECVSIPDDDPQLRSMLREERSEEKTRHVLKEVGAKLPDDRQVEEVTPSEPR